MAEPERIDPAAYVDFQRSMWVANTAAGTAPSYEAIYAALVFDGALLSDAQEMWNAMSPDVYVERGLAQWERDFKRHALQLDILERTGVKEARAGKFSTIDRDFVRPFLDGVWGEWVAENYASEPGGRPPQGDPVFPPTAGPETVDGKTVWKARAYAAETASLWNQVYVAWSFDRELGAADRLGIILNRAVSELEESAPGEDPTLRDKAVQFLKNAGDALNEGALNLLESVGGGALAVGRVVGVAAAIYLGLRFGVPALRRAFGRRS